MVIYFSRSIVPPPPFIFQADYKSHLKPKELQHGSCRFRVETKFYAIYKNNLLSTHIPSHVLLKCIILQLRRYFSIRVVIHSNYSGHTFHKYQ